MAMKRRFDMILKQISALEFIIFYGKSFPAIARYYSRKMSPKDLLFLMTDENREVGVAIIKQCADSTEMELVYIYVAQDYRGKGYGSWFFKSIVNELIKRNVKICYTRTVLKDESLISVFQKWGFKPDSESIIVRCNVDSENIEKWKLYSSERKKYIEKWQAFNKIKTISFSQADSSMLNYIYDMKHNDFPKELNSSFIAYGNCGDLVPELSFISCNEQVPLAYTMVTKADKNSLVFAHISTAEKWKGTGVFAGAFFNSMDEILKSNYHIVSYTVMSDNKTMLNLISSMFSCLTLTEGRQIYWSKIIGKE